MLRWKGILGALVFFILVFGTIQIPFFPAPLDANAQSAPTTVALISAAVSPSSPDYYEGERRSVTIGGTIFVFYYDGANIIYKSSTDNGVSWSPTASSAGTGVLGTDSHRWTVATTTFDGGPRIVLLYWSNTSTTASFFAKRGTVSGTTITWDSATFLFSESNFDSVGVRGSASASTDSSGNIYAAFRWIPSTASYHYKIMKSTDGGLSWTTSLDRFNTGEALRIQVTVTKFSSGKMLFAYIPAGGGEIIYRVFDGASWGGQVATSGAGVGGTPFNHISSDSDTTQSPYIAYLSGGTSGALKVARWTNAGAFQSFETADSTISHSLPSITATPNGEIHIYTLSGGKVYETKKVGSSWQTPSNPFGTTFTSPDQLTAAISNPFALWVESGNTLRFGNSEVVGDLELVDVSPVQASFDPTVLVDSKRTLLRVNLTSTFSSALGNVQIELVFGPPSSTTTVTETVSVNPGTNVYFLPSNQFILPSGSEFTASAEIDPGNAVAETDEGNNTVPPVTFTVKDTKALRILYTPIELIDDPENSPSCAEMDSFGRGSSNYMNGTFPVAGGEFSHSISCSAYVPLLLFGTLNNLGVLSLVSQLDVMTWFGSFDKVVGVVRTDWFFDMTTDLKPAVGVAWPPFAGVDVFSVDGVLVEQQYISGTVTAQELAHTYGWVSGSPPGDPTDSAHMSNFPAPGYWVANRCEMGFYDPSDTTSPCDSTQSSIDFMHPSAGSTTVVDRWVSNTTFDFILNKFKTNPSDPPVIGASGIIFDNNTVILNPWYRFDSVPDIPLGNTGEFTVLYLDSTDQVIAQTGFDVNRKFSHDDTEQDFALFSMKIPDVQGTHKIVIKRADQSLLERIISPNPPVVTVTSPNGGETFLHGSTVNVSWQSSDADGDEITHIVSLSQDAGQTWTVLATGVTGNQFSFEATPDIFSDMVLVKVIATDGINTSEDTSDSTFTIESFSGGGQRPSDVNQFLTYSSPSQSTTNLPSGTTQFTIAIRYGSTVLPSTFTAELNGQVITSTFHPSPNSLEYVNIQLQAGRNDLVLMIDGIRADGHTATDRDRLVFVVG